MRPSSWTCPMCSQQASSWSRTANDFRRPVVGVRGVQLRREDGPFTADATSTDCGHSCHVAVKAKDYIFHPYQKR